MKRLHFIFPLIFLSCCISISAQPAQKLVNVVISQNHPDWKYSIGEEVTFSVMVLKDQTPIKNVTVNYEIGPECFPNIVKKGINLKDGTIVLKGSMKEPGFLRCKVTAQYDGHIYEGLSTAAIDPEKIKPVVKEPSDFDAFWKNALAEAEKVPLDARMQLLPEKCTSTLDYYEISFQNDAAGSRIFGILVKPRKEGRFPAVLYVPGAGIRPYNGSSLGDDVIVLEIGIHGIPVTMRQEIYNDLWNGALKEYFKINMNDKDNFYYKRVYIGCVRAIDFLASLPETDDQIIGVSGGSQGGALSIVTAALNPKVKFLAALYPALCDNTGYLKGRAGGWPHYYRSAKPKSGEVETLQYFDVVNFAKRVKVTGWYSWGYNDLTCPPTTSFAAYNVISAPKEFHPYPESGHWNFPEQREARIEWLATKCKGK